MSNIPRYVQPSETSAGFGEAVRQSLFGSLTDKVVRLYNEAQDLTSHLEGNLDRVFGPELAPTLAPQPTQELPKVPQEPSAAEKLHRLLDQLERQLNKLQDQIARTNVL